MKVKDHNNDSFYLPLAKIGIATRAIAWILAIVFDVLIPDHEHSTTLLLNVKESSKLSIIFHPLVRWDAAFFIDISKNGYEFFKNHPFFPGYPIVVKAGASIFQVMGLSDIDSIMLSGVFINHVCFVASLLLLYK